MDIRPATLEDIDVIVNMGLEFLDSTSPYKDIIGRNPEQMKQLGEQLITGVNSVVLMAELGMIGLVVYPHPISGETFACEIFWWVSPTARKRRVGLELLKAAETWARERGATKIQMGAPNNKVARFYEHLGYQSVEVQYQRTL